jgi:hypothetical protein
MATKTAQDARDRIDEARGGSLANTPTFEYLSTLRAELKDWLVVVEKELQEVLAPK